MGFRLIDRLTNSYKSNNIRFFALLAILVVFTPTIINFIGWRVNYLNQVFVIIPIWIIAGLSLTIINGYGGEISLAQAALMGIGSYTTAILSTHGVSIYISIIIAIVFTMLGALLLSIPTMRVRGPYFVVVSMAFNGIFHQIVLNWIDLTRGPNGISGLPSYGKIPFWGTYLPWIVAAICVIVVWQISRSRFGKTLMAIRDDDLAASAIGIRVSFIKTISFLFSGVLASIAGILLSHLIGYVSPDYYTIDQSIFLLSMVLLGSVRKIEGVVLGAFMMVAIQELLRNYPSVQLLFYGLSMLIVISFVPHGIYATLESRLLNDKRS